MNQQPSPVIWISPDIDPIQGSIAHLKQYGHTVTHLTTPANCKATIGDSRTGIVIVSHHCKVDEAISICLSIKSEVPTVNLFSILITDHASLIQKERYFESGGNDLIIGQFGHEELRAKITPWLKLKNENASLSAELAEASNMALTAMESSSDLGSIISFVKDAINAKTYSDLAEHIFSATKMYSDSSIIEIKKLHSFDYFFSNETMDTDMMRFMDVHKSDRRVIQFGPIIQINHNHLVLVVEGLPVDDKHKMGRISDSLVMLCDIADRFAQALGIEERIQKSEHSRQQFLNTLSHELRTPVNSILGFSRALVNIKNDKPIGGTGLDALNRIIDNTSKVDRIINTLLEISGTGEQTTDSPVIEVDRIILRIRNEFIALAKERKLDLIFSVPEGLIFKSNEKKVISMLHHLMENAIKFTDEGRIELAVGTEEDPAFGNRIFFNISDTGIGIDTINHTRIFSEIGQLNTGHDRRHYGIGLGLYYVAQMSQQLGGDISLRSELGEGSVFTLSLPVNMDQDPVEDNEALLF